VSEARPTDPGETRILLVEDDRFLVILGGTTMDEVVRAAL
jgi:hypothetical protein